MPSIQTGGLVSATTRGWTEAILRLGIGRTELRTKTWRPSAWQSTETETSSQLAVPTLIDTSAGQQTRQVGQTRHPDNSVGWPHDDR